MGTEAVTGAPAERALALAERAGRLERAPERPADMAWLSMAESDLVSVLRNSLYPGAADESVRSVIGYCKAQGLNVMQKPVHIVPMWIPEKKVDNVKVPGTGMMRDVIMPGIGHYRTQASRSGAYMGKTKPIWGPMVKLTLTDKDGHNPVTVEVPESCEITVFKLVQGQVVEFTAEEFWIENYATKAREDKRPNAMWTQRSRGQLAKVTEAQALRQAFPEFTGGETAEEMEGKSLLIDQIDPGTGALKIETAGGAVKQLDRFAGGAPAQDAKSKPKGGAKPEPEPEPDKADDTLPTEESGEVPQMPGDASNDWETSGKWSKGWRWLQETMPTLGPKTRQALAEDHADLLWAVNKAGPAYSKAALEFVKQMGVTVPEKN